MKSILTGVKWIISSVLSWGEKERVNREECNREIVQYSYLLAAEKDLSSIYQVK